MNGTLENTNTKPKQAYQQFSVLPHSLQKDQDLIVMKRNIRSISIKSIYFVIWYMEYIEERQRELMSSTI